MAGIIQKIMGRYKVYLDRTRTYIGYIQFIAILFVFFESYKETKFGIWFFRYSHLTIPAFIILFFVCSIILGYFDKKYIRGYEQDEMNKTNPWIKEVNDKLIEIEKKL